jgi:uncharacterized protein
MDGSQSVRINFGSPVALFPLDMVLLPQQPMPLHIFEPRYRQMIDIELDRAGQIAIATVDRDAPRGVTGDVGIRPVVCVGQIISHDRLPDGRFHVVLHGLCRAKVASELPLDDGVLYRRAMLEPFGSEGSELPAASDTMERLRTWVDDALEDGPLSRLRIAEQVLEYVRNDAIPTPVLLDVVGFTMVSGREPRYQMLSEPDADRRTRLLHAELARLAKTIQAAEQQHPEAWPKGLSWN